MRVRSVRMLCLLLALTCVGCGRLGVGLLPADEVRPDAELDASEPGADAELDASEPGADAGSQAEDAAETADALPMEDTGTELDAGPMDGSADAGVPDCLLTVGGTVVPYRTGDIGLLEGTYSLALAQTGLCAGPAGCTWDRGSALTQASCAMSTCQMWESVDASGGWLSLRNAKNGACLYMPNVDAGTSAISWECFGSDRMRWQAVCAGNDTWHIISKLSNKALEGDGSSRPDAGIVQSAQADSTQSRWKIVSNPMPFNVVMASAETDANPVWRYTTSAPSSGWTQSAFDDSRWSTGPGAFGDEGRSYTAMRTSWTTNDIWLRRSFALISVPASLTVKIFHDEDADIFINGMLVETLVGWAHGYRAVDVPASVMSSLREGANTIAVHCHNVAAPQFIDVGLVTYTWQ